MTKIYLLTETSHASIDHEGIPGVEGGGSGLATGTTFPGAPDTGDRFRRSDLDYMVFFWDGTRWLSEQVIERDFGLQVNVSTESTFASRITLGATDIYLMEVVITWNVSTTNSASHYWNFQLLDAPTGASHGTANTSTGAPSTWTNAVLSPDDVIDVSTDPVLRIATTKTGSPGNLNYHALIRYRLVAA